ncbi:U3 small nucleolar RNA-associated protein 4 [Trichomonascus vanleenenianus]|uniref:small subunit rRNA maturation protein UTP4 n=1 Tax=Trichomonascus vanleenenianus TaxID=2268995 RepID=UPI003ECAEC40
MNIHRCRFVDYSPHSITSLKFSAPSTAQHAPHDLRLAVGRSNGDIEIWNPRWSWIHEMTLKGGVNRAIEGLAWSIWEDGTPRLFSIGGSSSITEWDLTSGMPIKNHDCNGATIWSIAVSADGTKLAAGCDDGSVVIVDISGGPGVMEHLKILQRTTERVLSVAWKGKDQIVGGCADARIRVWSMRSEDNGRIVATMRVDKTRKENTLVWSVMVLKSKKQIISGDSTGSVKVWDATNFSLLQTFRVHEADVLCLSSDYKGESIFSAGVDRKIVCYKMVDSKLKRWASVGNRLLHAQDIRAMAGYEAKGASFLVTGGVERTLVVNSMNDFMDGMFRKIPITRHRPCVSVTQAPRLVTMWTDQTVKVWRIDEYIEADEEMASEEEKGKRLVLKMVLNNEENITQAVLSDDGSYIAISTLADIKVFELEPTSDGAKLQVARKVFGEPIGGPLIKFVPNSTRLVLITAENEVVAVDVASRQSVELEFEEEVKVKSKLPFSKNITHIAFSNDGRLLATARLCGVIELFDLNKNEYLGTLPRLSAPPTAIKFTLNDTLIVVTAEIKVLEFNCAQRAMTPWSRRNSDLLPRRLISLVDKCCGVFYDPSAPERIWLWGANWLCFIDLSVNIATERIPKRKLDRLGVPIDKSQMPDRKRKLGNVEVEENGVVDEDDEDATQESAGSNTSFWITFKYRPMLVADLLGEGEFVVVERPPFNIPLPPAFWSNHKIKV